MPEEKFNPTDEVPSLELCKKLREQGYPQDGGGWYWLVMRTEEGKELASLHFFETRPVPLAYQDYIKAPTLREIGEWLKKNSHLKEELPEQDCPASSSGSDANKKVKQLEIIERAKSAGISCINTKCKYWNNLFSQNCSLGTKEGGPFIEYCNSFIPERIVKIEDE